MSSNNTKGKLDLRNVKQTQFDRGQVDKAVFSELQSALRTYGTNSILKDAFTHFVQTLNGEGLPISVEYYQAIKPAKDRISFSGDNNGDKAGKYFALQEFISKKTYVFYYVVDGDGTAPLVGDIQLPVNISENDPASVVAYATKQVIDSTANFVVTQKNYLSNYIEIEYFQFGETEAVDTGNSGFLVNRLVEGESYLVGEIELSYSPSGDVIYNGNLMKGLRFNQFTASFDVEFDEVEVSLNTTSSTFNVSNVYIPLAGVETAISIPNGTKKFKIRSKQSKTKLEISNTAGGDTFTVPYGAVFEENNLDTTAVTLYVTTSLDDRTIELITWN